MRVFVAGAAHWAFTSRLLVSRVDTASPRQAGSSVRSRGARVCGEAVVRRCNRVAEAPLSLFIIVLLVAEILGFIAALALLHLLTGSIAA